MAAGAGCADQNYSPVFTAYGPNFTKLRSQFTFQHHFPVVLHFGGIWKKVAELRN